MGNVTTPILRSVANFTQGAASEKCDRQDDTVIGISQMLVTYMSQMTDKILMQTCLPVTNFI